MGRNGVGRVWSRCLRFDCWWVAWLLIDGVNGNAAGGSNLNEAIPVGEINIRGVFAVFAAFGNCSGVGGAGWERGEVEGANKSISC